MRVAAADGRGRDGGLAPDIGHSRLQSTTDPWFVRAVRDGVCGGGNGRMLTRCESRAHRVQGPGIHPNDRHYDPCGTWT